MGAIPIEKGPRGRGCAAGCSIQTPTQHGNAYLSAGGAVGSRARLFAALRRRGLGYSGLESVHSVQPPMLGPMHGFGPLRNMAPGAAVSVCGFARARSQRVAISSATDGLGRTGCQMAEREINNLAVADTGLQRG